jgi:hypothetical protein
MSFLRSDAAPLYCYQGSTTFEPLFSAPVAAAHERSQAPLLQQITQSRRVMDGSACATQVRRLSRMQTCFTSAHRFKPSIEQTSLIIRTADATPLCEADAAAEGDVLFDVITESHQFCTAHGVVFADYEEVDDVTPQNYARLIRELNLRDFGRSQP